jgi:hypothetical protein
MKPHCTPDPRFDIDLAFGRDAEWEAAKYLTWLKEGSDKVEVKHKRPLDLNFFVETHCDKGRTGVYLPSGITTTIAVAWVFFIETTGISVTIPTDELRAMLTDPSTRDVAGGQEYECPTKGKLVSLNVLLYRRKQRGEQEQRMSPQPTNSGEMVPVSEIPFRSNRT